MILELAPQQVEVAFSNHLQNVCSSRDALERVKAYFVDLSTQVRTRPFSEDSYTLLYANIDSRISKGQYFDFPGELLPEQMNCLERTASFHFGISELYPESNPTLAYLTLQDKNVHAVELFTHQGTLYGADPTQGYFGPISLVDDALCIHPGATVISRGEEGIEVITAKQEDSISFVDVTLVPDHTLEVIISNLRKPQGIIDFFYESGQQAAHIDECYCPHTLFMYIDHQGNIQSQVRVEEQESSQQGCIKMSYGAQQNSWSVDMAIYDRSFWHHLHGEQQVQEVAELKQQNYTTLGQMSEITDYLQRITFGDTFVLPPIGNFAINSDARDVQAATQVCPEFAELYEGFVRTQQIPDLQSFPQRQTNRDEMSLEDIGAELNSIGARIEQQVDNRFRFNMLRLVWDARRYTQEIRKHYAD